MGLITGCFIVVRFNVDFVNRLSVLSSNLGCGLKQTLLNRISVLFPELVNLRFKANFFEQVICTFLICVCEQTSYMVQSGAEFFE